MAEESVLPPQKSTEHEPSTAVDEQLQNHNQSSTSEPPQDFASEAIPTISDKTEFSTQEPTHQSDPIPAIGQTSETIPESTLDSIPSSDHVAHVEHIEHLEPESTLNTEFAPVTSAAGHLEVPRDTVPESTTGTDKEEYAPLPEEGKGDIASELLPEPTAVEQITQETQEQPQAFPQSDFLRQVLQQPEPQSDIVLEDAPTQSQPEAESQEAVSQYEVSQEPLVNEAQRTASPPHSISPSIHQTIHEQVASVLTTEDHGEPAMHQANNLEVDSDEVFSSDADSALGVSLRNSTASLSESVMQYREENGRTYHGYKDGKYVLPNDESENERLDLQHHMFMLTLDGKLNLAPLKPDIQRVLDLGTGTGIWAIEFAQQYPSAEVIGTDLSPIQPLYVPPNLRFEICDAEEEWDFSQPFDYVHGRMMTVCFEDISVIFREAFKSLRSGGWIEMQDLRFPILSDDGTTEGTAMKKWNDYVLEASAKLNRSWDQGPLYVKHLQDAGYVDITEIRYDWPIGPWPRNPKDKEIGLWCRENFLIGMQGISMAVLTRGLGWTREQVEVFLVDVRKDALNRRIHAYIPVYFVFARKP